MTDTLVRSLLAISRAVEALVDIFLRPSPASAGLEAQPAAVGRALDRLGRSLGQDSARRVSLAELAPPRL